MGNDAQTRVLDDPTDETLMLRVRGGDDDAFDLLVRRYRNPIFSFILRSLGDRETAEELSQDAFVRLWSAAGSYVPTARFSTYLYHIARNLCRDHLDRLRTRTPALSLNGATRAESDWTLEETIQDPRPGPDGELTRRALAEEIENALSALNPDHRDVFMLTEIHGLSYEEASSVLQCPVGTVASRKYAAMRTLRRLLASLGAERFRSNDAATGALR